jgi:hypothetical protein
MPDAKDNAKMTGDTHPPEVESDLPLKEDMTDAIGANGTPRNRGKAGERGADGRPGRAVKKGGVLKDKDDEASDSNGNTRDWGESRG